MAWRPAWTVQDEYVVRESFEFQWNGGFATSQKQKNVENLHRTIRILKNEEPLEISTKGLVEKGKNLSAFILPFDGTTVECVFQASKKFANGGPYTDLLHKTSVKAKKDERLRNSGPLIGFSYAGVDWGLSPRTGFYDYIYVTAMKRKYGEDMDLSDYAWFTDIEFNPNKSVNCQARAVAIYKLLQSRNMFWVLDDITYWRMFHKMYVKG